MSASLASSTASLATPAAYPRGLRGRNRSLRNLRSREDEADGKRDSLPARAILFDRQRPPRPEPKDVGDCRPDRMRRDPEHPLAPGSHRSCARCSRGARAGWLPGWRRHLGTPGRGRRRSPHTSRTTRRPHDAAADRRIAPIATRRYPAADAARANGSCRRRTAGPDSRNGGRASAASPPPRPPRPRTTPRKARPMYAAALRLR